jgi:lipopolysaccharide/colanic/teichoic acid biosynthesis glycosyltransferase
MSRFGKRSVLVFCAVVLGAFFTVKVQAACLDLLPVNGELTVTQNSSLYATADPSWAGPQNTYAISPVSASLPELSTSAMILTGFAGVFVTYFRRRYWKFKRFFDVSVSLATLIIFSPVLLIAAILIKLESPGPVFFRQERVGLNRRKRDRRGKSREGYDAGRRQEENLGTVFTMYKLRTMRADAEAKTGPVWAKKNDTRITRVGKLLRKTHVDEIPQFYNVLQGDMSIIGPRPERPVFVNRLHQDISFYHRRYKVKPGITGLAQVRYQYADSLEDTKKKVKYDILYIRKMCMIADLRIFFGTFSRVLFDRGAH